MRFVVVPWSWRIEPRTILVVGPTFEVEGGAKVRPRHPVHQIERKKKQQEQEQLLHGPVILVEVAWW
jgi:hypothetical protein